MVNFGYPYNDLVICKDSTDYLRQTYFILSKNSLSSICIMFPVIYILYITVTLSFLVLSQFFQKNQRHPDIEFENCLFH